MDTRYQRGNPLEQASDAAIIPIESGREISEHPAVSRLNEALGGELSRLVSEARFTGKIGKTFVFPTFGRVPARRVVLTGVGAAEGIDGAAIRRAWGAAALAARSSGASQIVSALPSTTDGLPLGAGVAAAAEGVRLATYRFTRHHGAGRRGDPTPRDLDEIVFVGDAEAEEVETALRRAEAVAAGVNLARDLVNEPASVLTPETMAEQARQVATETGLECNVLGPDELETLGAGALLAAGRGSANEPRLIHLVYRPDESQKSGVRSQTSAGGGRQVSPGEGPADTGSRVIGLVGKGITFDTGGYSIKPYEGMLEMKGDMAGAAAVLGTMSALAAVGCRHTVHAVLCAAENMISDRAFRPGDVLTAMNGVTIEILSTDAEGRLVLADGLVYAARHGATELIDLATLTGAASVALGEGTTALFASDERLARDLLAAAAGAGERLWRMPLIDELNEKIKGQVADVKNSGGRNGGAITAALFLQRFTEGLPWAHLDIAPSARAATAGPAGPRGASGVGVRSLLTYLSSDGAD